jgi:hypothetical protein
MVVRPTPMDRHLKMMQMRTEHEVLAEIMAVKWDSEPGGSVGYWVVFTLLGMGFSKLFAPPPHPPPPPPPPLPPPPPRVQNPPIPRRIVSLAVPVREGVVIPNPKP